MAPLPFNNTAVLFLDYSTAGRQHTMQVRYATSEGPEAAMTDLATFLSALGNSHRLMTVNGARAQAYGTDISYDIPWTGAPTYGIGAGEAADSAQFYSFIGRSVGGRRVRVTLFGAIINRNNGVYRAPPGADAAFAAAIETLQNAEGTFLAIDAGRAIWKQYVNLGDNAYWRNHIR